MAAERATERLYYTDERDMLVREGDPRARYLATIPGRPMPEGVPVASASDSGEKPKQAAKKKPAANRGTAEQTDAE